MSSGTCKKWHDAITALVEGRFDDVSPDEIEQVETHLNECEACANRLNHVTPTADPLLDAEPAEPSAEQWEGAWDRIDDSAAAAEATVREPRRLPMWAGLSAAAVVVAAVGLWQSVGLRNGSDWAMQLAGAGDVQIESLEVFGDATTMVLGAGDDAETPVIWVMEEEGA